MPTKPKRKTLSKAPAGKCMPAIVCGKPIQFCPPIISCKNLLPCLPKICMKSVGCLKCLNVICGKCMALLPCVTCLQRLCAMPAQCPSMIGGPCATKIGPCPAIDPLLDVLAKIYEHTASRKPGALTAFAKTAKGRKMLEKLPVDLRKSVRMMMDRISREGLE